MNSILLLKMSDLFIFALRLHILLYSFYLQLYAKLNYTVIIIIQFIRINSITCAQIKKVLPFISICSFLGRVYISNITVCIQRGQERILFLIFSVLFEFPNNCIHEFISSKRERINLASGFIGYFCFPFYTFLN